MDAPQAILQVGTCQVHLLGTIPGFVPDEARVRSAFASLSPDLLALGVPVEDLAHLETLRNPPEDLEIPEPDDATARLLKLLERFGPVRVPPPDLSAAYALAKDAGIPIEALDLDDAAHTEAYTRSVKLRHVVQDNFHRKRLLKDDFTGAADAYALAIEWETRVASTKPLAKLEAFRHQHMARRIKEIAPKAERMLAVVPVARFSAILAALGQPSSEKT